MLPSTHLEEKVKIKPEEMEPPPPLSHPRLFVFSSFDSYLPLTQTVCFSHRRKKKNSEHGFSPDFINTATTTRCSSASQPAGGTT